MNLFLISNLEQKKHNSFQPDLHIFLLNFEPDYPGEPDSEIRPWHKCRGEFYDTVLDWEHELPANEFDKSFAESKSADLNLVLGSSLQIQPANKIQKVLVFI